NAASAISIHAPRYMKAASGDTNVHRSPATTLHEGVVRQPEHDVADGAWAVRGEILEHALDPSLVLVSCLGGLRRVAGHQPLLHRGTPSCRERVVPFLVTPR